MLPLLEDLFKRQGSETLCFLTEEANLQYLLGNVKQRRRKANSTTFTVANISSTGATNTTTGTTTNKSTASTTDTFVATKKQIVYNINCSSSDTGEEEGKLEAESEEVEETNSDNNCENETSDYFYLVDNLHYDDDGCLF